MHGVGDAWARRAFGCFSLPAFVTVGCQQEPDPEFPTVAFPNPEEQGALKEAMLLAEERGASCVLFFLCKSWCVRRLVGCVELVCDPGV